MEWNRVFSINIKIICRVDLLADNALTIPSNGVANVRYPPYNSCTNYSIRYAFYGVFLLLVALPFRSHTYINVLDTDRGAVGRSPFFGWVGTDDGPAGNVMFADNGAGGSVMRSYIVPNGGWMRKVSWVQAVR